MFDGICKLTEYYFIIHIFGINKNIAIISELTISQLYFCNGTWFYQFIYCKLLYYNKLQVCELNRHLAI